MQHMTKAEIRKEMAERKKRFQSLDVLSVRIVQNFQTLECFRSANSVGAYMPLPDEADIRPLFRTQEKTFYVPAFDETAGIYRMARLTQNLKKGRFGISEPAVPVFAGNDELDLIIVPGVAFDITGRRIGRGGGFYDRLLPLYRAARIGVCFDFQCLEEIPAENHDVRMNWLVTEERFLEIPTNS